jgi:calcineurin-like phosphoesterase family protein
MTIWFTSDWHIDHAAIVSFSKRPFANVDEMNEGLVRNYQAKVKQGDKVFFLGDFGFSNPTPWLNRLPGEKFFIMGNHDASWKSKLHSVKLGWIKETYELSVEGFPSIWLSHYPHLAWPKSYYGSWHLHGHTHGRLPDAFTRCDVGVDSWNYSPVSLEEIGQKLRWPKKGDPIEEPAILYPRLEGPAVKP